VKACDKCVGSFDCDKTTGAAIPGTDCSAASNCSTCVDIPTKCTSCSNNKFLLPDENKCVDSCPVGYRQDKLK
jgi:hypothetical protein